MTTAPEHRAASGGAVVDSASAPPVAWGLGDVAVGIVLWLLTSAVVGAWLAALDVPPTAQESHPSDAAEGSLALWATAISLIANQAFFVGFSWWTSATKGIGDLRRDFGLAIRLRDLPLGIAAGAICLLASAGAAVAFAAVTGNDAPTNATFLEGRSVGPGTVVALLLLIGVATPIAEEIFFRGLVLRAAAQRYGTLIGVLASATIFGVPHAFAAQDTSGAWFFPAVTTFYGIVLATVATRSSWRLGPSIVGHIVINVTGVLIAVNA